MFDRRIRTYSIRLRAAREILVLEIGDWIWRIAVAMLTGPPHLNEDSENT